MPVRSYVYRLRPTRAQHAALETILMDQRRLYNAALEEDEREYARTRITFWRREEG